ncbi:hypothetical protein ACFXJ6_38800, partial [Streptomyces sp. NPDC059218]|uniref:hypothetical protein n=1 Tax=Streptomyces sp. NPDC059218 TaxID=3346773 RepID=UPI0036922836
MQRHPPEYRATGDLGTVRSGSSSPQATSAGAASAAVTVSPAVLSARPGNLLRCPEPFMEFFGKARPVDA